MTRGLLRAGGALSEEDVYVRRPADDELAELLQSGRLCYVLAPRQMGKSSLRRRTVGRLAAAGIRCAEIDLMRAPSTGGPEAWLGWLHERLANELGAPDVDDPGPRWWEAAEAWLETRSERLIVFLDEIDSIRGLPGGRDLLASVRGLLDEGARFPMWRRLTFCLLGVARPEDLMDDPNRGPFNVGEAIRLEDFTREQARELMSALPAGTDPGWLDMVYPWTSGHPFQTQRLLMELQDANHLRGPADAAVVEQGIRRWFLAHQEASDHSLRTCAKGVLESVRRAEMIALYRRVRFGEQVPAVEANPDVAELLLHGMVARTLRGDRPVLKVRNRIFEEVFGERWVTEHGGHRPLTALLPAFQARLDASMGAEVDPCAGEDALLSPAEGAAAVQWATERNDLSPLEVKLVLSVEIGLERAALRREQGEAQRRLRLIGFVRSFGLTAAVALMAAAGVAWQRDQERSVETTWLRKKENLHQTVLLSDNIEAYNTLLGEALLLSEESVALGFGSLGMQVLASTLSAANGVRLSGHAINRDLPADQDRVMDVAYTLQGTALLSCSRRMLISWDPITAQRRWTVEASDGEFLSLVPSADGLEVLVLGTTRVDVYQASTGARLMSRKTSAGRTVAARLPGGDWALADSDGIWLVGPGRVPLQVGPPHGHPEALIVDSTGARMALRLEDGQVLVSGTGGKDFQALELHPETAGSRWMFFASEELLLHDPHLGGVQAWSMSGERRRFFNVLGVAKELFSDPGTIMTMALSPDGRSLAIGGGDTNEVMGWLQIWSVPDAMTIRRMSDHAAPFSSVEYSPDGHRVAVVCGDDNICLLDADTGDLLKKFHAHSHDINRLAFSPDDTLATASADGTVGLWQTTPRSPATRLTAPCWVGEPDCQRLPVFRARWSGKGAEDLVSIHPEGTFATWKVGTDGWREISRTDPGTFKYPEIAVSARPGRYAINLYDPRETQVYDEGELIWKGSGLKGFEWVASSGGERVLVWDEAGPSIQLIDPDNAKPPVVFQGRDMGEVIHATASPDGQLVAATYIEEPHRSSRFKPGRVVVWRVSDGVEVWSEGVEKFDSGKIELSAAPHLLAYQSEYSVQIVELSESSRRASLERDRSLWHIQFSKDGRKLLTTGSDKFGVLWDVRAALEAGSGSVSMHDDTIATMLIGHTAMLRYGEVSPDGTRVVTASDDGTVRLWDVATARQIWSMAGHTGVVREARFSPDGEQVLSVADDGLALITPASLRGLQVAGCRLVRGQWDWEQEVEKQERVRELCQRLIGL